MITRHIAELLYHHECVIVPGLGGFIRAYRPAQIFDTTHEFYPPSCCVAFNSGLSGNDGVLANHIATIENTTFREALYEIKQWAEKCHATLNQGGNIELDGIGELLMNASGKIEFTPSLAINFNTDSFGLPVFFVKTAKGETDVLPEIPPLKLSFKGTKLYRFIPETLKWAAVLAPFIAFALWGSLNGNILNNYVHNYTGMYSWVRSTPGKTATVSPNTLPVLKGAMPSDVQQFPGGFEDRGILSFEPGVLSYAELAKNNITIVDSNDIVPEVAVSVEKEFYVIGGAFRDQKNAMKLISILRDQGYPASIVDNTPNGLYVVSMKGFDSYEEAVTQLAEVKSAGFSASWILKKHKG